MKYVGRLTPPNPPGERGYTIEVEDGLNVGQCWECHALVSTDQVIQHGDWHEKLEEFLAKISQASPSG
jgi:hypothetical protein